MRLPPRCGIVATGCAGAAIRDRTTVNVRVDGLRLFDVVQSTWNVLEPSVGPALSDAHAAGLGVIVKEALANGRLTERSG